MFDIRGKNIIITGSGKGIGLQLANGISEQGANVIRIDKNFKKKNKNFCDFKFNLENLEKISKLVKTIHKKFYRIDGLINNAGVTFHNSFSIQKVYKTININLISSFELTKKICPIMAKNKFGSIINITSLGADFGFSDNPSYQMSKAGLKQLTKSIAMDWGKKGIRCNNIKPGYIESGMTKKSKKKGSSYKKRLERMIIPRWGLPADIVGAAIFLMSNESSYITGTDIVVDGGWSIKGI